MDWMIQLFIGGTLIGLVSPWIFLWIHLQDRRREERLLREMLVYMKSSSSFEAEDMIDRVRKREKSLLEKGIAKLKKEGENLSEDLPDDMATDMRTKLRQEYEKEQ